MGRGQRDMTHGVKNRWWMMEGERKCGGRTSEERGMNCEAKRDVNWRPSSVGYHI